MQLRIPLIYFNNELISIVVILSIRGILLGKERCGNTFRMPNDREININKITKMCRLIKYQKHIRHKT